MSGIAGETLFWPEEKWRALQARRLGEHLRRAVGKGMYQGLGIRAEEIDFAGAAGLEGVVAGLPFTTKDQLAAAAERGEISAGGLEVAEWVCTSGTLGRPLDVPLTGGDLKRLAENEAVALSIAGITNGDVAVLAVGMERMFVAGLAYWLGARKLGAACARVGARIAEQGELLGQICGRLRGGKAGGGGGGDGGRVFVIGVPSYLVNVVPPQERLAGIVAIGEPVKRAAEEGDSRVGGGRGLIYNSLGAALHQRFGCAVMSTYAMTETCTTFAEGPECGGGHLNPELGIVEVIDGAGGHVKEGQIGEVVVTPLGVEGMPLVRFRTGDMAALYTGKCACGRTTPRVGPIVGRKQQLLKIRGVSMYPGGILEAVRGAAGVVDCAVVVEEAEALSDRVTIFVQVAESGDAGVARGMLQARLRGLLRVVPEVRVVGAGELLGIQMSAGMRKVQRFIDRRKPRQV